MLTVGDLLSMMLHLEISIKRYWMRAVSGRRYVSRQCADKNCKCRSPDMQVAGMIKVLKCGLSVNSLCAVKLCSQLCMFLCGMC